jgi:hypothetical protein
VQKNVGHDRNAACEEPLIVTSDGKPAIAILASDPPRRWPHPRR